MNLTYMKEKEEAARQLAELKDTIHNAEDILSILSLLRIFRLKSNRMSNLERDNRRFVRLMEQLEILLQNLS